MSVLKCAILSCFLTAGLGFKTIQYFDINLDLPPKQRWKEVTQVYRQYLIAMQLQYKEKLAKVPQGKFIQEFVENSHFEDYPDLLEELEGIVEVINHPDIDLDTMKVWQMLYEMQSPTMCSSVLLALPNGTVLHGRNMDYAYKFELDGEIQDWYNVTFVATMHKKGKPVYTMTQWPGHVILHTGMRFDGWTVDQQTRALENKNDWASNLAALKQGGKLNGLVLRNAVDTIPDFETAKKHIYETSYAAPQYFIMAGAKSSEGCVLTIDQLGKRLPETPPMTCLSKDRWHLVQANEDINKAPLFGPLLDARQPLEDYFLSEQHQGLKFENPDELMYVLHSTPLFDDFTAFSTVMIPATGYYKNTLPFEPPMGWRPAGKNWIVKSMMLQIVWWTLFCCCCIGMSCKYTIRYTCGGSKTKTIKEPLLA